VRVGIRGADFATLARIAGQLRGQIAAIPGISDVESSFDDADPALSVEVKRDAAASAGVNLDRVGATLSTLLAGTTATTWEAPDGENYDVRVQIPRDARSTELLDVLTVASEQRDADGQARMVPLSTVADIKQATVPRQIDRMDQSREVTLTANIQGKDAQRVFQQIDQLLQATPLPPGYRFDHGGQSKDMAESFSYAVQALAIGVIFIYMILVAQFRSFTQPVAIMMSLPLALIGVMVGLLLWGSTLNLFSIIGVIMLMGLAAKNGILLVDFANQSRREGLALREALIEAGRVRMRPILMTSFAMIFGMLPLALALGEGSETRAPMAHAVIGGMVTSTLLTLIVVPVVYSYLEGMGAWWRARRKRGKAV
jgi:HAE1 family hydrophobic/amphiphilic exporter-1